VGTRYEARSRFRWFASVDFSNDLCQASQNTDSTSVFIWEVDKVPWEKEFRKNITSVDELAELVDMTGSEKRKLEKVVDRHPMSITRYYASLIDWNDPDDPLRRMMVPSEGELDRSGIYDQSGEQQNTKLPGLQHKYTRTALILSTNRCTSYCRYCFRKRLVGLPTEETVSRLGDAVKYIMAHPEINNILVSGGDPLCLSTKTLKKFIEKLAAIDHLDFIRLGTKVPVTMPRRISEDRELYEILKETSMRRKRLFVSTQFNHPRELTPSARRAVNTLHRAGVVTNNQTVLMKGVNDDPEILASLQRGLTGMGVIPYYVFQCRPVKRVKKLFQVPMARGFEIVEKARSMLDGYSKRYRYVMSHLEGKIAIAGMDDEYFYFRFHQARNPKNDGKFFKKRFDPEATWLDDLKPA
jgi:KamA family protein